MLLTCALREVVVSLFTFFAESSTEIFQAGTLNLTTAVSYTKGHAILHQPEINHKIKKAIDAGYQVCFWPSDIIQKDINDLVLSGYDIDSIMKILDNPLKNFNANLKLFSWSKI